ncbi:DNA-binding LacI/PurR family transcriptional regulator [Mycetocola sp. CAN_C7]|uniref:LacI family DNA-binding transcriptional regulator n=1 Tax=Mycetocola sp. CAN_C7 TaxID=2787724 RepID=UPI0018C9D81D
MNKRPTSRDVARLAGVSQSTVSFVFNGRDGISEATRDRVQAAAAELNYRPNLAARSMRTQRTGRLAVVIPVTGLNLFPVLEGAVTVAREAGYVVEVVTLSHVAAEREAELSALIGSGEYEGFLALTPISGQFGTGSSEPVVLSLSEFDDELHATGELMDARPMVEMMEKLVDLGHRRFVHIAGPSDYPSAVARRQTYLATVERLEVESLGVLGGSWSGMDAYESVLSLPDTAPPLAVLAANDVLAAAAIRAAFSRGWTVPGDMSVTGWDDVSIGAFMVPSLTSVFQDRPRLGAYSMRRLIARIRGEESPARDVGIQRVVWRESISPPRTAASPIARVARESVAEPHQG